MTDFEKNDHTQSDAAEDLELQTFFDAARVSAPQPSGALLNTIHAEAQRLQPNAGSPQAKAPARGSWWGEIWQEFGGWRAAAALSACLFVGLSLGYNPPDALDEFATTVLGTAGLGEVDEGYYTLDDLVTEG